MKNTREPRPAVGIALLVLLMASGVGLFWAGEGEPSDGLDVSNWDSGLKMEPRTPAEHDAWAVVLGETAWSDLFDEPELNWDDQAPLPPLGT